MTTEYRIQSNGLIHSPGLCASLRNQFKTGDGNISLFAIKVFAAAYPAVPVGVMWDYFTVDNVNLDRVATLEDKGKTLVLHDRKTEREAQSESGLGEPDTSPSG
jgi:hypothetical protein